MGAVAAVLVVVGVVGIAVHHPSGPARVAIPSSTTTSGVASTAGSSTTGSAAPTTAPGVTSTAPGGATTAPGGATTSIAATPTTASSSSGLATGGAGNVAGGKAPSPNTGPPPVIVPGLLCLALAWVGWRGVRRAG